jgi:anti-anti-sigma factor
VSPQRSQVVLPITGDLDVAGATVAYKRLLGLTIRPGDRLVLDLSELDFMDSTGIRLILRARDHAIRHGARFAVVPGPRSVMRVLEMVGLDEQLELVAQG